MSDLLERINDIRSTVRPRPTFTLERGRGETYRHPRPVLYAHSVYERSSVLAGQPRRLLGGAVGDVGGGPCRPRRGPQGRTAHSSSTTTARAAGTSYIPSSVLTRHLPDDEG